MTGPTTAPAAACWEHFPHAADIGIRGMGATRAAAFEQAAVALTAVVTDPERVVARDAVTVSCTCPDPEMLFVDWLNALIYEMATRRMLFRRYEVHIDGDRLSGTAWGEPVDVSRHEPAAETKGATLTALSVNRDAAGRWVAQCVIDV